MRVSHRTFIVSFVVAGALGACATRSSSDRRPAAFSAFERLDLSPLAKGGRDPSWREVNRLIDEVQPRSATMLLKAMKAKYPRYFDNYVAAYESRDSTQAASAAAPRVILFGESARFVTAFNGLKSQRGFHSLETIDYDSDGGFSLREISFQDGKAQISEANPQRCLQCHSRENPRPVWDTYFLWPGFYGSEDDHVFRPNGLYFDRPPQSLSRISDIHNGDIERENLLQFILDEKPKNPRYALLGSSFHATLARSGQFGEFAQETRPNFIFLKRLQALSLHRASVELATSSAFARWRYALTAGIACAERAQREGTAQKTFLSFLTDDLREEALDPQTGLKALADEFARDDSTYEDGQIERMQKIFGEHMRLDKKGKAALLSGNGGAFRADIQFILRHMDLDLNRYALNLKRVPTFHDGGRDILQLVRQLALHLEEERPSESWSEFVELTPSSDCERFAELSRQALGAP